MTTFAGRWMTLFGPMELVQTKNKVYGTYWYQGIACKIVGELQEDKFVFRYQEPTQTGEGWFELTRYGQFRGQYRPVGAEQWGDWNGHREWDGIWDASYGRLRLIQEEDRIIGFYDGLGPARIEGRLDDKRLVFRYHEPKISGDGWFEMSADAQSFQGQWRPDGGSNWGTWTGKRILPYPNLTWLIVFEAYWQHSLVENEYSYGVMLKEFFARVPNVAVRQRFFNDEVSLLRWCRELLYIPEPALVLISSHGMPNGVNVHGQTINTKLVVDSLREANNVLLLHFAACLMLKEESAGDFARRIEKDVPFPISGYTTSVDWGGSAVSEFGFLDMILNKKLTPEQAALRLPKLITFSGEETPPESPYPGVGFRFLKPGSIKAELDKKG